MGDQPVFPKAATEVANALSELFRHQGTADFAELVADAEQSISVDQHDNWDGGIWYCTLHLEVQASVFARFEEKLEEVEHILGEKVKKLFRSTAPYILTGVTIGACSTAVSKQAQKPTVDDEARIWEAGTCRLFLSHISAHKEPVAKLKTSLGQFGISAFVAHEDIEPNLEWQQEIERALISMHALCALLTPNFHESNWTDQEVGFALGRNVPVLSVRLGIDPYGFIGKNQGMKGNLESPYQVAGSLANVLSKEVRTKRVMRDALVGALERSRSFDMSRQIANILATLSGFSQQQLESLRTTAVENGQVREAWGVAEIIGKLS